jgi:hypothetical protein
VDSFASISLNFLQPLLDVVEGLRIGHIVHDNDAMRATVIGRSDRSEAFLASSIPDLEFHSVTVDFKSSDFLQSQKRNKLKTEAEAARTYEVYTNRGDERFSKSIVRESEKQAALSDSTVANQQKLKQIVTRDERMKGRAENHTIQVHQLHLCSLVFLC